MAETTGISWTDGTWNPWMGCSKVSEACKNCYMFRDAGRYGWDPTVLRRSKTKFYDILNTRTWPPGKKVFTCSWSDFFHPGADEWRPEAWEVIRKRPDLIIQILTKRPERIKDHLPANWGNGWPNVWLGVTAENQQRADERIVPLLRVPAAVHFVSCEPLLGPITFRPYTLTERPCFVCEGEDNLGEARGTESHPINCGWRKNQGTAIGGIDWIITGGESGTNARPSHPDWFRSLRDECKAAGVSFHFKQWGEWLGAEWIPGSSSAYRQSSDGVTGERFMHLNQHWWDGVCGKGSLSIRVGTNRSGRLLDGQLWDQLPTTSTP